jgi:nuclease-like protein
LAKILRSESSLRDSQEALDRELGRKKITRFIAWGLALALCGWGVTHAILTGSYAGVLIGLFVLVLAGGYEVRLREITVESHNLEGGRRGEQKMANALAERLADNHLILNDLEFRVGFERCQIDHLVLAPSGIFVIESKYWAGTLTGDINDTQWTQKRSKGDTKLVKSPILQNERQRRMFITLLAARVPEDRIFGMAVFSHPHVQLRVTHRKNRAFLLTEAIHFINSKYYDPPILSEEKMKEIADHIKRGQH